MKKPGTRVKVVSYPEGDELSALVIGARGTVLNDELPFIEVHLDDDKFNAFGKGARSFSLFNDNELEVIDEAA